MHRPRSAAIASSAPLALIRGRLERRCGAHRVTAAGPDAPSRAAAAHARRREPAAPEPPPRRRHPAAGARPTKTATRTPAPKPTTKRPALPRRRRYDLDLNTTTSSPSSPSMCFNAGGVLRLQGIGPGLVTRDAGSLTGRRSTTRRGVRRRAVRAYGHGRRDDPAGRPDLHDHHVVVHQKDRVPHRIPASSASTKVGPLPAGGAICTYTSPHAGADPAASTIDRFAGRGTTRTRPPPSRSRLRRRSVPDAAVQPAWRPPGHEGCRARTRRRSRQPDERSRHRRVGQPTDPGPARSPAPDPRPAVRIALALPAGSRSARQPVGQRNGDPSRRVDRGSPVGARRPRRPPPRRRPARSHAASATRRPPGGAAAGRVRRTGRGPVPAPQRTPRRRG